jgi:hypothetical protein
MPPHDAGGRSKFPLELGVYGSASFHDTDDCRRVWLQRHRGDVYAPYALWIGMNPSTAGHLWDDPTCRREWIFTTDRLGLDRYVKCNVGDYCLTDSRKLDALGIPVSSARNLETIRAYAIGAHSIVLAHGVVPKCLRADVRKAYQILIGVGRSTVLCLGRSLDGSPRHPLYLKSDTPFETVDLSDEANLG